MGRGQPADGSGAVRRALPRHARVARRHAICSSRTATPAPIAQYRLPIRVITEYAWHSLFARNLFIVDQRRRRRRAATPQFTIIDSPSFKADPARHGTRSRRRHRAELRASGWCSLAGTSYAGEIKKSVFSVLNYLLPLQSVLPMHCSANVGAAGDVALFFGLSGTGKTTLSSDPDRRLIGDDEHGWSDRGVFNFEGGCYAKTIRLSAEAEPQIYATTRRFGTVLENVVDRSGHPRARSRRRSVHREHPRGVSDLVHRQRGAGRAGRPSDEHRHAHGRRVRRAAADRAADAGGAMYHFLSGYTAKVAGTEKGVTEPKATFSTCFGAPFLPLPPSRYAHDARRADRAASGARVAGQHRLDRRRRTASGRA